MFSKQVLSALLLLATSAFSSYGEAASLRGNSVAATHDGTRRNLADDSECTLLVAEYLGIPGETAPDSTIDCGMDNGMIHRINATPYQKEILKQKWMNGEIASGQTSLGLGAGSFTDDNGLFIPPGLSIAENLRNGPNNRRRLKAPLTGDKPILVVKVTDSGGLARSETPAQIGDDVFGTLGDPVNLKSQLYECSHGKMNVVAGTNPDPVNNPAQPAPGVIEVSINVSLVNSDRYVVHNAVTAAVNAKLGTNLVNGWDQITTPYHQVMYVTEKCYIECGWAAYAYINGWMSVYQSHYYKQVGVQVHELGHNFGLYHSGGLDGATYTDHTGMMGNPLYSDDIGKMCYNAAKNWAITWYDDAKDEIDPVNEPSKTVELVGIADYDIRGDRPVTIRVGTGGLTGNEFIFVGFNRAIRANAQNDEADDEVTITKANSAGNSQSYLQAHLLQGESHTVVNFAGTGRNLVITAQTIIKPTEAGVAGVATVSFDYQGSPTSLPTPAPTSSPTLNPTAFPTASPTAAPSLAPTMSAKPSNSPTKTPTSSPTISAYPTKSPTVSPTAFPTASPTPAPTEDCSFYTGNKDGCNAAPNCAYQGGKDKLCVSSGPAPAPAPAPAPTPTAPSGPSGCSVCAATGQECCGTCIDSGNPSKRGCFLP